MFAIKVRQPAPIPYLAFGDFTPERVPSTQGEYVTTPGTINYAGTNFAPIIIGEFNLTHPNFLNNSINTSINVKLFDIIINDNAHIEVTTWATVSRGSDWGYPLFDKIIRFNTTVRLFSGEYYLASAGGNIFSVDPDPWLTFTKFHPPVTKDSLPEPLYTCTNSTSKPGYNDSLYIRYATDDDIGQWRDFFNIVEEATVFPGEGSGTGGGEGTFDATSDEIEIPGLPTLSAVNAGFVTLYQPTISQLNNLAEYMWSDLFSVDTVKKLFADPMDVIIGLSIVPVSVPVNTARSVKIGIIDTGVAMNVAASQYASVDCGSIDVKEFWGSALDYTPYTKFSIYLPYIGTREIKTDDIMGKTISVVYHVDILSGSLVAMIKSGNSVLYSFSGSCATSIPVTSGDWTRLVTSAIQLAGTGVAAFVTGGVGGAMTGATAGMSAAAAASADARQATWAANTVNSMGSSTANMIASMKPTIQRSGAVSGSAGMLGIQVPYLIGELPRQSLADDYNKFVGYPSNITKTLGELSGYTVVENIHLENCTATSDEKSEIEMLLKSGVIL